MDLPRENAVVSDGSTKGHEIFGLPLAAVFCIAIVGYGLLVLICIFMRQVMLNRRPLSTLESLHCCDCLLLLPRPAIKFCDIPCNCSQTGKTENPPCNFNFEWLRSVLASLRCRLPESGPSASPCWPPALPAVQCPSSVRCCGLEIRRDTRPGMVDASVSGGDVLRSPASLSSPAATAVSRSVQHGATIELADSCRYSQAQELVSAVHYSQHGAGLGPAQSCHYSQHPAASSPRSSQRPAASSQYSNQRLADSSPYSSQRLADSSPYSSQRPADSSPYGSHQGTGPEAADSGDSSQQSADSRSYSQQGAVLDPAALLVNGSTMSSALSTAA